MIARFARFLALAFGLGFAGAALAQATTTTLATSGTPSGYASTVTFTATVVGSNPVGTVTFKDGSSAIGAAGLTGSGNTRTAVFSTNALTLGTHSMTAVYSGDGSNSASTSSAVSQVVNKATTTVSLSSTANPSTAGTSITLTATVTGASPSGSVNFKDGATNLGWGLVASGQASVAVSSLAAGSHSLTAVYSGDTYNGTSTSAAFSQTVNAASGGMTLSATPASAMEGQNVTIKAQIAGYAPTGVVTFVKGTATIGTANVSGGAATLSTASLPVGSHSIGASWPGDANNASATASAISVTISARSGSSWQYGYTAMGRPNTAVDPNALATYTYWDSLGRPIQTQQPANTGTTTATVTDYGWNLQDGLTSVTDPRALATTYGPDGLGNVKTQTSPDSGASTFTFDAKGNVTASVDARGKTTTFTYDNLDRLTAIGYPTGTGTTFEYDGGGSPNAAAAGELTKITDESGQTTYGYDSMGRLTTKTVVIGTRTFSVGYSWGDSGTALDKLTAITYPSGSRVNYGYDSKGFVNAISVNAVNSNGVGFTATTSTLLGSVTYNAENQPTGWQWSDGKARTIGYDSQGQVVSYTLGDPNGAGNKAGSLRTLTRDPAGRITAYSHTNNGSAVTSLDQSFAYDSLNRLTAHTQASGTTAYTYDATGNRTAKTVGGTPYTNTVASTSNRLTQVQNPLGTNSISYDAAGNITGDGSITFGYSDRGRMSSATTAGGTVTYVYNALNLRVRKSAATSLVPTGQSHFVYDENGQLLGEYDASGNPLYETIYLGMVPVGALKQTGTAGGNNLAVSVYNVHSDQIATPRLITQQDHTIVWRWDGAEAFGATAPDQNPSNLGTFAYNQRFPGQTYDNETGLFQNWNREYNARLGRYTQSDPIGLAGGINTFLYVDGDPLSNFDPEGLDAAAMSLPAAVPSFTAACLANAGVCAPALAGVGGFAAGTLLYPYIAEPLGDVIDQCVAMASEHKSNRRPSNWNKHTKPRPGRDSEKKRQDPNWKPNPNKKK